MITQQKGRIAEKRALDYLKGEGLQLVLSNYACPLGEIDLIMRDKDYLVFIEVRSRTGRYFGDGAASVNYSKRKKIIKTSAYYLIKNRIQDKFPLRIDVVSIDGTSESITWLKNAFDVDYDRAF